MNKNYQRSSLVAERMMEELSTEICRITSCTYVPSLKVSCPSVDLRY